MTELFNRTYREHTCHSNSSQTRVAWYRGSNPTDPRWSRSNRGPVALCTLGLGLLNPPSFRGW